MLRMEALKLPLTKWSGASILIFLARSMIVVQSKLMVALQLTQHEILRLATGTLCELRLVILLDTLRFVATVATPARMDR